MQLPRTEQAEVDEQQEDECDQRLASLAGKILQVSLPLSGEASLYTISLFSYLAF